MGLQGLVQQETALKTLCNILSKGFVMTGYFSSSDKYLIFKSSLISRNLHFPSLQNAFRHPHMKPRSVRTARKSEPFLFVAETLLLLAEHPWAAQYLPVPPGRLTGLSGWLWPLGREQKGLVVILQRRWRPHMKMPAAREELRTTALARHLIHALSEKSTFVMLGLWKEHQGSWFQQHSPAWLN